MATTRSIELSDDISRQDMDDVSQDVKRMIRRARATKRSRMFLDKSIEPLAKLINQQTHNEDELTLDRVLEVIRSHDVEAFDAINPFVSFFYSDGLLPGEVSKNALLLYAVKKADELGYISLS